MGLFDFVFHAGEKFTKDEIKILDRNFNSISAHTKKKYKFFSKEIVSKLYGSEVGVNFHRVTYRHQQVDKKGEISYEDELFLHCDRYYLRDKNDYEGLKNYFEDPAWDDYGPAIKMPDIEDFPTPLLVVGYRGNGFAVAFEYNFKNKIDRVLEDSGLSKKCVDKINISTVKYLKRLK